MKDSILAFIIIHLIHTVCATNIYDKIVGGSVAPKERYPYQVALMVNGKQYCGGTLIASEYVLSAAHCGGATTIQIGQYDFSVEDDSMREVGIIEEIFHPQYKCNGSNNDIMLYKIDTPIHDVNFAFTDKREKFILPGQPITIVGWGSTDEQRVKSDILLETGLDVVANSICQQMYPTRLKRDQMCGLGLGTGACSGDSGGPAILVRDDDSPKTDIQVGIISHGIGCARPNHPIIFTRVGLFRHWIAYAMDVPTTNMNKLKNRMRSMVIRRHRLEISNDSVNI